MGKMIRKPGAGGGVKQLTANVQGLDGLTGKVGWFESAKYSDGTPVAYVASIQEFGAAEQNIPARATMRPAIAEESKEWTRQFGQGAKAVALGNYSATQVMDAVGALAAGDVAKRIAELQSPPLKPATVDARRRRYADRKTTGSLTKPLVDTALLVTSITHLTEKK